MDQELVKSRSGPALTLNHEMVGKSPGLSVIMSNDHDIRQTWVQVLALPFFGLGASD